MHTSIVIRRLISKVHSFFADRRVRYVLAGLVAAFVLANLVTFLAFRDRSYPGTQLDSRAIGAVQYDGIEQKIADMSLLPDVVRLQVNGQEVSIAPSDLGVSVDGANTAQAIQATRSWLPIWNLIRQPHASLILDVQPEAFQKQMAALDAKYATKPKDARIIQVKRTFEIQPETNGTSINVSAAQATLSSPEDLRAVIVLPLQETPVRISAKSLAPQLETVRKQAATKVTIQYSGKQKQLDTATIFARKNETYQPSAAAIAEQIMAIGNGFGISVGNLGAATNAALAAVTAGTPNTITLEKQVAKRSFTYCVATRGVANTNLGGLRSKLRSVFADKRGWALDGAVAFSEASSGCDFTVWLSQASQMPSFGAICDSMWSCRVGANVVINFDRWQNASPAWNAAGGSLDEYRAMVINHETGHWFGFYHRFCSGAGQPAPVMQQQSINLQGCTFNAWPTAAERADFKAQLGI